ncbi:MAG: glucosamine-6-phosphate deaminase [Pirellulaceae bacterium]
MRIVILESSEAVAKRSAEVILNQIEREPESTLGLATGGTPLGTYAELVRAAEQSQVDFSGCTTFNLDEYVGLEADHPQSYRYFMRKHLFEPAGFDLDHCHFPSVDLEDIEASCEDYEVLIEDHGGIELQLLGIGTDGHIAFNEQGSSLASRTRIKALAWQTRKDNARFFDSPDQVPELAVTMGIASILDTQKIVLMATGLGKAEAIRATVEGPISASLPASALQLHPNVMVLLDEQAASLLERAEYYRDVESIQRRLETPVAPK